MLLKYKSVKPEGKLKFAEVDQFPAQNICLATSTNFLTIFSPKNISENGLTLAFSMLMVELTVCGVGTKWTIQPLQLDISRYNITFEPELGTTWICPEFLRKVPYSWYLSSLVFLKVCSLDHLNRSHLGAYGKFKFLTPSPTCWHRTPQGKGTESVSFTDSPGVVVKVNVWERPSFSLPYYSSSMRTEDILFPITYCQQKPPRSLYHDTISISNPCHQCGNQILKNVSHLKENLHFKKIYYWKKFQNLSLL